MAINLDHVTQQLTVTDTAANVDLTFVPKGTGVTKTNGGLAIQSGTGSFPSTGYGLELFNGDSGNNWIQSFNRTSSTYLTTLYNASSHQFRTSGTEQFRVSNTASAVNYVQATGAATGSGPTISAQGSDTNVNLFVNPKGTGALVVNPSGGYQFTVVNTSSTVNWLEAKGGATGSGPQVSAVGTDTNINLNLTAKGTGGIVLNTNSIDAVLVKSSIPTILGSTLTTNLSNKYFVISSRQYTTTEVGTTLIGSENTSTANSVMIGGYYGELNAASTIQFYTAGTVTTRSGTKQFQVSNTSSAVNFVQVTGSATGGSPIISTEGSDANAPLILRSKGAFACEFQSSAGAVSLQALPTASSVNYYRVSPATTGFGPVLSAQGSDTNIDLSLTPKGTGNVRFGTHTGTADTAISGYIEIKDSGGTIRKLAVIT
jgi:hypothetical protein